MLIVYHVPAYTLNGLLTNEPSVIAQIFRSLTNNPLIDQ